MTGVICSNTIKYCNLPVCPESALIWWEGGGEPGPHKPQTSTLASPLTLKTPCLVLTKPAQSPRPGKVLVKSRSILARN